MVSTSGDELLPNLAVAQLCEHLLPHTTVLTPNIPEASLILSHSSNNNSTSNKLTAPAEFRSVADLEAAARSIQALGPRWVLVKGGHLPFRRDLTPARGPAEREVVVDVLVGPHESDVLRVESPWQESMSTHGTGCSLACEFLPGVGLDAFG